MSYLELDGNRHAIPAGESVIGSDASSLLALEGPGIAPRHLVVVATSDGQTSVRRATDDAETYINGVLLGPQPAPLLHGDKIEVGGREFSFVDERRSGSTTFVSAEDIARLQAVGAKPAAKRKATAGTGGRLVSLTDGREYAVEGGSLVFGREASCQVVVAHKRVSRRHAEITATPKGYVVIDMSSNGTFVNGERVSGQRLLARADVIRVGDDEFRFYADKAVEPEAPAPSPPPPPPLRPLLRSLRLVPRRRVPSIDLATRYMGFRAQRFRPGCRRRPRRLPPRQRLPRHKVRRRLCPHP